MIPLPDRWAKFLSDICVLKILGISSKGIPMLQMTPFYFCSLSIT